MKSKAIPIASRTGDPLQVSHYLALMSRSALRKVCRARCVPAPKLKGAIIDNLAADLTRTGGTLFITIQIPTA